MSIQLPTPSTSPGRRRRAGLQPRAIAVIAVAWLLMWDALTWGNLLNGVLVGIAVTIVFPMPTIVYEGRPRPLRIALTATRFFSDLVQASVQVIWLVVRPGKVRAGAIVEVDLTVESDLYLTLVSIMTTLVPGSVVVEARRQAGILYIHELMVHDRKGADRARHEVLELERRIVKSLGSRREIALVEAARRARLESDIGEAASR